MLSNFCLKCKKDTESKNPNVARTEHGRIMLLSKCACMCSKLIQGIKWIKSLINIY